MTTSHGGLVRDSLINLAGQGLPLIAALVALPFLLNGLGPDRFGILALAWVLVGYASLFDFGLGRALTQLVAQRLGAGQSGDIPALAWTGLALMTAVGVVIAGILAGTASWVTHGLKIPAALQAETVSALRVLCLSIPFVTCTAGLRGMLEARQRFGPVNAIRATLGVLTFLGPIAILPFSNSLEPVMWLLLAVRVVAWGASVALCAGSFPDLRRGIAMRRDMVAPLFTAGGWITVSNIVGPVITYLDRFLIGALLSAAAVAYYVTPYEVVTKFLIFPTALAAVLFPAFAAGGADARHVASLYSSALKYVLLFMYPAALIVVAVAPEAMSWWLGSEFPSQGAEVARVLTVGVLLNALAYVPYALAQAVGRADWVARLHLVELAVYVPLLYAAVEAAGIVGAAIAWSVRVAIDFAALVAIGRRLLPRGARSLRLPWSAGIACCALLAAAWLVPGFAERALLAAAGCAVFATLSWKHWLSPDEKAGLATWAVTARDRPRGGA